MTAVFCHTITIASLHSLLSVIVGKGTFNAPHGPVAKSKVVVGDNFVLRRDRAVSVGHPRRHIGAPRSSASRMTIGARFEKQKEIKLREKALRDARRKERTSRVEEQREREDPNEKSRYLC